MLDKYMYSSNTHPFMIFLSTVDVGCKNVFGTRKICLYNHICTEDKITVSENVLILGMFLYQVFQDPRMSAHSPYLTDYC